MRNIRLTWALAALTLLALGVRAFRLEWQPLWWDEGYSVYFATEPLARMFWLTARDIHPPLYYALLHGWLAVFDSTRPEVARLLSVLSGAAAVPLMAWLAQRMQPNRPRIALIASFLLAISPLHLFYSQEVRMYGPALLLTLLASIAFWHWVQAVKNGGRIWPTAAAYIVSASLALWTLYYTGFLLAAHLLWAALYFRRSRSAWLWLSAMALCVLVLQAPWWVYALPRLLPYIADKVIADKDLPLLPWDYLWRHLVAFSGGHLAAAHPVLRAARWVGPVSFAALALVWRPQSPEVRATDTVCPTPRATISALTAFALVPILLGYLVNLRLPFFPEGGERLLLTVLPYLLLWLAWGLDGALQRRTPAGWLALPILLSSIAGIITFYTLPRYTDHDYRPIVTYVSQHGRDQDTVFAIFPWQVGYWRAYAARRADGGWLSPQPSPLDQEILVWNRELAHSLDQALQRGTVWFPAPLSFGSSLPGEIETYLSARGRNAENLWFSPATRLSAWVQIGTPQIEAAAAVEFDAVTLTRRARAPVTVASANTPVAVDLLWETSNSRDLHVSLRLLDAAGALWAYRDYEPLGSLAAPGFAAGIHDALAFLVPAGLPPQTYTLALGVGPRGSDRLFAGSGGQTLTPIAELQVTQPPAALDPARLPAEVFLQPHWSDQGLHLFGFSGVETGSRWLAGTPVPLRLFTQKTEASPHPREVSLTLRDLRGQTAAAWSGWPLPDHPFETWPVGTLMQIPVAFDLPATLEAGEYRLQAALPEAGKAAALPSAYLVTIQVERRTASYARPEPQTALPAPAQLGTHAVLYGYAVRAEPGELLVELDWEILQTLLPAHDIFVHLTTPDGRVLGQADGPPVTADGPAPSGSWLPGEFLRTQHTIPLPTPFSVPLAAGMDDLVLLVGLYRPDSQLRLPVIVNGVPLGDSVSLPLAAPIH